MKTLSRSMVSFVLLLSMLIPTAAAANIPENSPYAIGVSRATCNLEISDFGKSTCTGSVTLRGGYTADMEVNLYQDGTSIKTWTASGSGTLAINKTYFVMSGHDYLLTTTATVYDSDGDPVDYVIKSSEKVSY